MMSTQGLNEYRYMRRFISIVGIWFFCCWMIEGQGANLTTEWLQSNTWMCFDDRCVYLGGQRQWHQFNNRVEEH